MFMPVKENSIACAIRLVEQNHMCGGCHGDRYCKITSRFAMKKSRARLLQEKDRLERKRLKAKILRLEERLLED